MPLLLFLNHFSVGVGRAVQGIFAWIFPFIGFIERFGLHSKIKYKCWLSDLKLFSNIFIERFIIQIMNRYHAFDAELVILLEQSQGASRLNLRNKFIEDEGCKKVATFLTKNPTLQHLDLKSKCLIRQQYILHRVEGPLRSAGPLFRNLKHQPGIQLNFARAPWSQAPVEFFTNQPIVSPIGFNV